MNVRLLAGLMLAGILASGALDAIASESGEISVKEFHIGMDRDEVLKLDGLFCSDRFDLGGCYTVAGRPITDRHFVYDRDDKLVSLTFDFATSGFDSIKRATLGKYPKMKCSAATVENRMGAVFTNDRCLYQTKNGSIVIERYGDKLDFGLLRIVSNKFMDEVGLTEAKTKKDI